MKRGAVGAVVAWGAFLGLDVYWCFHAGHTWTGWYAALWSGVAFAVLLWNLKAS